MQIKAFLPIVMAAVATASPVANPNYKTEQAEAQYTTTTQVEYATSTPQVQSPATTEAQYPATTLQAQYTSTPQAYPTVATVATVATTTVQEPEKSKTKEHKDKDHKPKEDKTKEPKTKTKKSEYPASSPASSSATPTAAPQGGLGNICPGTTPLCCQLDVDGILDLTCGSPAQDLNSIEEFESVCASTGLTAECCTLSLLGDGLLCTSV
ncbi:fungal hydrophobin-domain-containing protein [Hypoxylon sp. FL1284]|nr:fungal hydrophobin-domain-containing protein [Hypoxylon sp. FL1284]